MKNKINMFILLIFLTTTVYAQPKDKPYHFGCDKETFCRGKKQNKSEFFEQRIKILKEKGFITEQEEKELIDKINEVKNYRNEVWSDDKLTKEEQQQLRNKERELREKIHQILERTKEQFMEEKTLQEREKFFNEKVDKMLKDKKITKKQADELKKQYKELLVLEEKIWSDGVMTKEEQRNLLEKRKSFNKKMREILMNEHKKMRHNFEQPPAGPHFKHEKGQFIPEDKEF